MRIVQRWRLPPVHYVIVAERSFRLEMHEDLRHAADLHSKKRPRCYSNDLEFVSVDADRATEDVRGWPVQAPPQSVTNHADGWGAGLVIRRLQGSAYNGGHSKG